MKNRTIDDLAHEVDCISITLSEVAYAINGGNNEVELTNTSIQDILFGLCNHLDRIAEDMENLESL